MNGDRRLTFSHGFSNANKRRRAPDSTGGARLERDAKSSAHAYAVMVPAVAGLFTSTPPFSWTRGPRRKTQ